MIINPRNEQKQSNLRTNIYFSNLDIFLKYACNLNTLLLSSLYKYHFNLFVYRMEALGKSLIHIPTKEINKYLFLGST